MADLNLQGENVLIVLRTHWAILARDSIAIAAAGLFPLMFVGVLTNAPYEFSSDFSFLRLLSILWLLIAWFSLAVIWTNYYLDIWIVTDRHIHFVDQIGLFNRQVRTIGLENIEEMAMATAGPLATYFGYGTIEIRTASAEIGSMAFSGVPNPEMVRALILDQIELLPKLMKENEELTSTAKKQEQLIHLVGHEVKSYLTKSSAALSMIAEGDLGDVPHEVQETAGSALAETRKGVDTVMNILHGADPAKGTLALEKKPFDLKAALIDIAASLQPQAREKGLQFDLFATGETCTIHGDEAKLRDHVFRNLIDNAIRYTSHGSIHMELSRTTASIRFLIRDTGVGITAEDSQKLFTEGGHGAHSTEINKDSTGFGLFIAKQIVESHGGTIRAESAGAGQGSTFIVELPAA